MDPYYFETLIHKVGTARACRRRDATVSSQETRSLRLPRPPGPSGSRPPVPPSPANGLQRYEKRSIQRRHNVGGGHKQDLIILVLLTIVCQACKKSFVMSSRYVLIKLEGLRPNIGIHPTFITTISGQRDHLTPCRVIW